MKSKFVVSGLAIVLGMAGVGTIGLADGVVAQASVDARKIEADRLLKQGIQQHKISQFEAAFQSWIQALKLYREIKDRQSEGNAIGNLGFVFFSVGNYSKAIEFQEQSLAIAREIKDRNGEGRALGHLGNAYSSLGNYPKGIEFYEQSLVIARDIKDRQGEGIAVGNLGNVYLSLGNYPKAIEFQEQHLVIAREIKDRDGEGRALGNLGTVYSSLANYSKAIEFYEQNLAIAREIKNRQGEGIALGNLGTAYSSLGNYPKGIEFYEQSLVIARDIKDRKGEGSALSNLGTAYSSLNDYPKAIGFHEQSLAIAREIKDQKGEGRLLGNLGSAYFSLGNYPKAIGFHEQSLAIDREIRDRRGEGQSLGNLGNIYLSLGNYPKAIGFYEQSLAIARKIKDREGEGASLSGLGLTYDSLGNYPKAIEFHQQSLTIFREIKDRQGEGTVLGNLGIAYRNLGNYPKAIEFYEQSLAIARKIKNRKGEGGNLGNLGTAYSLLGNHPKAIEFYEEHLAIVREIKDRQAEGNTIGNLGSAYYFLSNYPKAIEFYEQSLAIAREIKNRGGEQLALSNLGLTLAKQEPELAIVFYKQSVNVAESIRIDNRTLDKSLQSSYTETVAKTYRNLADLLLAQGLVLEAQQVLELLKTEELRTYSRDTRAQAPKDKDVPLIPPEKGIPAAFNDKIALGTQLTQCETTKCPERTQLTAEIKRANTTFDQLVKRLKTALKNQEQQDPAQLQTEEFTRNAQNIILANPKVKTLLLYPLVLDDKLWLVWGTQAGKTGVVFDSKSIPVTRKDLSTKVLELQTLLSNPNSNPKELQKISQQLYQWLIQPIRKQLDDNKIQNIVFSLDRATRYIPMNALHDGKQYLVENFSTSTILTAQTDNTDRLSPNLQDNPILGLGLTQSFPGFGALPAVQTELDSIIKTPDNSKNPIGIYPGLKLFNQDFTEEALTTNIADHRILHIATHGSFLTSNPDESFILLGNGKKLSIPNIESMKNLAGTHLVVLSACETGKGGINSEGLEVAGMGHYFLKGGAKSVMASLWLVNDPATALIMHEFYNHLAQGQLTKAQALQQVQIAFLKGNLTTENAQALSRAGGRRKIEGQLPVNSLAHPYYWAPFFLMGNNL